LYQPIITSYDYSSPLNEAGDPNPTYAYVCQTVRQYNTKAQPAPVPPPSPKANFGAVAMTQAVSLFDTLTPPFTRGVFDNRYVHF